MPKRTKKTPDGGELQIVTPNFMQGQIVAFTIKGRVIHQTLEGEPPAFGEDDTRRHVVVIVPLDHPAQYTRYAEEVLPEGVTVVDEDK